MEAKPILTYVAVDALTDEIHICDEKGERTLTRNEFKNIKKDYTLFYLTRKRGNSGTLKEYYDYTSKCAQELKQATKGKINLYKTGQISKTSYMLWNIMKTNEMKALELEDMTELEIDILTKAKGSIIFSQKGYKGEGHFYDFASFYPSIMNEKNFLIPYKKPAELTIKTLANAYWTNPEGIPYLKYGYLHCIIHKSGNEKTDRLFRFQDNNWYTSVDIKTAKLLKLKIEMIQDGKPNLLYYDRKKCVTGSKLFGAFIALVYDLKKKKVAGAKEILNSLWGYICQKKVTRTKKATDKSALKMYPTLDGIVTVVEREQPFNPFARMKNFLLAEGRHLLVKTMLGYEDDIVQCHTDGFISRKKLDIVSDDDLGSIKYDGAKQVHIINANKVEIIDK